MAVPALYALRAIPRLIGPVLTIVGLLGVVAGAGLIVVGTDTGQALLADMLRELIGF